MTYSLEYYYVLFLDILGFSDMVLSDSERPEGNHVHLPQLHDAFDEANAFATSQAHHRITQFSDSIVLTAPYAGSDPIQFLINCSEIQRILFRRSILSRGGLSIGKHYEKDKFIVSQGLIESYHLESTKAKFPRIVISDDLIELCFPERIFGSAPVANYVDGITFVDFLRDVEPAEGRAIVLALWANSGTLAWTAREKIVWLVDCWNARQPDHRVETGERFQFL